MHDWCLISSRPTINVLIISLLIKIGYKLCDWCQSTKKDVFLRIKWSFVAERRSSLKEDFFLRRNTPFFVERRLFGVCMDRLTTDRHEALRGLFAKPKWNYSNIFIRVGIVVVLLSLSIHLRQQTCVLLQTSLSKGGPVHLSTRVERVCIRCVVGAWLLPLYWQCVLISVFRGDGDWKAFCLLFNELGPCVGFFWSRRLFVVDPEAKVRASDNNRETGRARFFPWASAVTYQRVEVSRILNGGWFFCLVFWEKSCWCLL